MGSQVGISVIGADTHKHFAHGNITHGAIYTADVPKQVIDLPVDHHLSRCTTTTIVLIGQALGGVELDIFPVDSHFVVPQMNKV